MHRWLRLRTANWLSGGLHALILAVAGQIDSPRAWPWALAAMALVSFAAWIANYRRLRFIEDTPTSRIASAAQGYVELTGTAEALPAIRLLSRLSRTPCLWFRYDIEKRGSDNKWSSVESGESDDAFVLRDATGECVVAPDGAEIVTSHRKRWTSGRQRHTEWLLLPQDPLYVIGEFVTVGGAHSVLDPDTDVAALLAEWKRDRPQLLARFDLNRDNEIDLREWELARRQARREIETRHGEIRAQDGTHMMRRCADGRFFLISNLRPAELTRRYHRWGWAHLAIFVGTAGGAFALL